MIFCLITYFLKYYSADIIMPAYCFFVEIGIINGMMVCAITDSLVAIRNHFVMIAII